MANYYIPTAEDCIPAGFTDGIADAGSASAELLDRAGMVNAAARRTDLETEQLGRYDRLYYALTPERAKEFFSSTELGDKWNAKVRFPLRTYDPEDGRVIIPVAQRIADIRKANGGDFDDKMLEIKKYIRTYGNESWEEWVLIASVRLSNGHLYDYLLAYWSEPEGAVLELSRLQQGVAKKKEIVAPRSCNSAAVSALRARVAARHPREVFKFFVYLGIMIMMLAWVVPLVLTLVSGLHLAFPSSLMTP